MPWDGSDMFVSVADLSRTPPGDKKNHMDSCTHSSVFFFFFFLGMKKQRPKAPDPGAFAMWMVGRDRFGTNKSSQKKKATK